MPLQKLLNKITDRDRLLAEIEDLKIKAFKYESQCYDLMSELSERTQSLNDLQNDFEILQNEYQNLSIHIQEHEKTITELEMNVYDLEIDKAELHRREEIYKSRYGEVIVTPISDNEVGRWDEDKGFFDHIEKIKGNPFNSHQVQAIRYNMDKHLRIIAGAGSGKTETICAKTAYLMTMEDVSPSRICMVTFTRKAADEMKERVNKFLGTDNSQVAIGTFHSIFQYLFNQLLKQVPACTSVGVVGKKEDDSDEKCNKLFRGLIKEYNLYNFDKQGEKNIKARVDYWTNLGYSLEEMCDFVQKHYDSIEVDSDYPISQRFYDMYTRYHQIRSEEKIVVFDDYLINLYNAIQQFEAAREFVQGKFDYIFVDEFQDINPLQMEILKLISPPNGENGKLIIVGDDDQSIYAFRGSDPMYIKEFHRVYHTYTIELMTNYRSKQNIVHAGNRVITENKQDRIQKAMSPFHKSNGEAFIWAADDPSEEANWIISKSQEIGKEKPFVLNGKAEPINYTCSTVLYRSVGQLQSVYQVLDSRNIPYVIENNEDVMGIFNISDFKFVFRNWVELVATADAKTNAQTWRSILLSVANGFFIRSDKLNKFLYNYRFLSLEQLFKDLGAFIKKEKPKNDVDMVFQYLTALHGLVIGDSVKMIQLIEPIFQFPKIKKEMSKEEMDWIKKECTNYDTWASLMAYHDRLEEKQKLMEKHLQLYYKGEYNALYFLTIHRSKGLAYDNVFVIGVHHGGLPSKRAVPLKSIKMAECKEKAEPPTTVEEERRLMYVAVTRAKHNLYVTFPKIVQGKPSRRSTFIKELNLELRNG